MVPQRIRAITVERSLSSEQWADISFELQNATYVSGFKVLMIPDEGKVQEEYFSLRNRQRSQTITLKYLKENMRYDFIVYALHSDDISIDVTSDEKHVKRFLMQHDDKREDKELLNNPTMDMNSLSVNEGIPGDRPTEMQHIVREDSSQQPSAPAEPSPIDGRTSTDSLIPTQLGKRAQGQRKKTAVMNGRNQKGRYKKRGKRPCPLCGIETNYQARRHLMTVHKLSFQAAGKYMARKTVDPCAASMYATCRKVYHKEGPVAGETYINTCGDSNRALKENLLKVQWPRYSTRRAGMKRNIQNVMAEHNLCRRLITTHVLAEPSKVTHILESLGQSNAYNHIVAAKPFLEYVVDECDLGESDLHKVKCLAKEIRNVRKKFRGGKELAVRENSTRQFRLLKTLYPKITGMLRSERHKQNLVCELTETNYFECVGALIVQVTMQTGARPLFFQRCQGSELLNPVPDVSNDGTLCIQVRNAEQSGQLGLLTMEKTQHGRLIQLSSFCNNTLEIGGKGPALRATDGTSSINASETGKNYLRSFGLEGATLTLCRKFVAFISFYMDLDTHECIAIAAGHEPGVHERHDVVGRARLAVAGQQAVTSVLESLLQREGRDLKADVKAAIAENALHRIECDRAQPNTVFQHSFLENTNGSGDEPLEPRSSGKAQTRHLRRIAAVSSSDTDYSDDNAEAKTVCGTARGSEVDSTDTEDEASIAQGIADAGERAGAMPVAASDTGSLDGMLCKQEAQATDATADCVLEALDHREPKQKTVVAGTSAGEEDPAEDLLERVSKRQKGPRQLTKEQLRRLLVDSRLHKFFLAGARLQPNCVTALAVEFGMPRTYMRAKLHLLKRLVNNAYATLNISC